jgi:hypothetical protein
VVGREKKRDRERKDENEREEINETKLAVWILGINPDE